MDLQSIQLIVKPEEKDGAQDDWLESGEWGRGCSVGQK